LISFYPKQGLEFTATAPAQVAQDVTQAIEYNIEDVDFGSEM